MKKLLYSAAALSLAFFAASCQQENLEPVETGSNTVTYSVQVPGAIATKANPGSVAGVTELVYEVYRINADGEIGELAYEDVVTLQNGETKWDLELEFVKDQKFQVLFWAQKPGIDAYATGDLRNVTINNELTANVDDYAAFAGYDFVTNCVSHKEGKVTLVRPISQIQVGTDAAGLVLGTEGSNKVDISLTSSSMVVKGLPTSYNVANGEVSETEQNVEYTVHAVPAGTFTANSKEYTYVAQNYVAFAASLGTTVEVDFTVTTTEGDIQHTVSNVPLKPNYRTNIIGNLITENADYSIDLEENWADDEDNVEVIVDGLSKINGVYSISTADALAYASQNLFAEGGSFVLTENIDMSEYTALQTKAGGKFWESVEISHKTFSFDGKGHTIRNLPGMFVRYTIWGDLTIKNLTLANPKIAYDVEDKSDKGVGAFFGFCDAFNQILLENCHVKGGEIAGGHWTGGLIGFAAGYNAEGVLTINNCSVKETTVTGKGSCGGIIGHANGGTGLAELNTISVFSSTIKSTGSDTNKAGSVMGTVGSATVKVINCSVIDNEVTSNNVANPKLWGRQGSSTGVLFVDGVQVEDFGAYTPSTTVTVTNDAELAKVIEVNDVKVIKLAAGTYSNNIALTVAENGAYMRDIKFEAVEGASPVIAGTVTLGYRNQGVGAAMWEGNVTFEGITFDHAEVAKHSISVGDVMSLTLNNCTIIGDGEYGIDSARGNGTGASKFEGCTFVNTAMQLLGNLATGLVIDGCTFNESRINVQAGNGVTVQNCTFNSTLKSVHVGDSFYCVRSNNTPITVKNCEINIDSELAEVATSQAKWGLLWNRGTTNWTLSNVVVNLTDPAKQQTELLITKCTSTGTISNGLIVNGVHAGVSQNAEGVWEVDDTAAGALSWLKTNNPEAFQNGAVQCGTALYEYSNNGMNATLSAVGEDAKVERGLIGATVKDVTVADGIKVIGNRTFRDAPNLTSVVLPQSLTELEEGAFQGCGLTTITIPGENVILGKQSIGYLPNLETITITAKKVTVGAYCARACTKLKSVYIYSDEITFASGGSMYFTDCESNNTSGITFYVSSQAIADAVNAATPNGHAKGMQIKNIDGTVTYYSR